MQINPATCRAWSNWSEAVTVAGRVMGAFNPTTIAIAVRVDSWEGAVDAVGELMVKAGTVLPTYVEAMKEVVRELGPYSVIAPGVALPHARPEDGVLEPGMAMVTLESPVPFGNRDNDPVDVVIGFAAVDKERHTELLAKIASMISDTKVMDELRAAITVDQALEAVEESLV